MSVPRLLLLLVVLCTCAQGITCDVTNLATAYIAETYFVVDSKALEIYINERTEDDVAERRILALKEIHKDIGYFLKEINKIYSSIKQYGLDIEVRILKLYILDHDLFHNKLLLSDKTVDPGHALAAFDDWIIQTNALKSIGYDVAILWTGYDLGGISQGYSHVGTVCSDMAAGVVTFPANYIVVETTAHEIAHILGANHDGAASATIMATRSSPVHVNRWSFSSCTAAAITEYISSLHMNCLETAAVSSSKSFVPAENYTGQLLHPDMICSRSVKDRTSYMCTHRQLYGNKPAKGDVVCSSIYCQYPSSFKCSRTYSSDGLICDVGKRCDRGKCREDDSSEAANVDPNCIWGDRKVLKLMQINFIGNCTRFIEQYGASRCYETDTRDICCETCKRLHTGLAGCEFGDRNEECRHYSKHMCTIPSNKKACCEYCKDENTEPSANNEYLFVLPSTSPSSKLKEILDALRDQSVSGGNIPSQN